MRALLLLLLITAHGVAMGVFPKPDEKDRGKKSEVFLESGGLGFSKEGWNLIIKHEVGGGSAYYNRYLKSPAYVSENSGITIGIGYDLRFNTRTQIARDWHMLNSETISRLQAVSGVKGTRAMARALRSVSIPYDIALEVFRGNTIPRYARDTVRAYPGVEKLHPHIQGAMLSWVFNRGGGIMSVTRDRTDRDREKRAMRDAIPERPGLLAGLFRASKRIWVNKGVDGLLGRREDEARLCELGEKLFH